MNKTHLLCRTLAGQAPFGFGAAIIAWALVLACALILQSPPAAAEYIQQGIKLVGGQSAGPAGQGASVSLSADGNTLIVGGPYDNKVTPSCGCYTYFVGAAWIFTRSDGVWTQAIPNKLVGSSATNISTYGSGQGVSVAMSGDGSTALVGGSNDGYNQGTGTTLGAAWVWTRSGDVWSQQAKLVDANASLSGNALYELGTSVALSFDGNTTLVGEVFDGSDSPSGGAWVFTRTGTTWSQGSWLTDPNAISSSSLGLSVALSSDGLTAILGDVSRSTAVVFTRSSGSSNWTLTARLVSQDATSGSYFGGSVALSGNGQTALVGGYADNSSTGAAWPFTVSAGSWSQLGSKLVGSSASTSQGFSVALSNDGGVALEGAPYDFNNVGDAWLFTRIVVQPGSGGPFLLNGLRVPSNNGYNNGFVGNPKQGTSVAQSADGSTAVVGGPQDTPLSNGWVPSRGWLELRVA